MQLHGGAPAHPGIAVQHVAGFFVVVVAGDASQRRTIDSPVDGAEHVADDPRSHVASTFTITFMDLRSFIAR